MGRRVVTSHDFVDSYAAPGASPDKADAPPPHSAARARRQRVHRFLRAVSDAEAAGGGSGGSTAADLDGVGADGDAPWDRRVGGRPLSDSDEDEEQGFVRGVDGGAGGIFRRTHFSAKPRARAE